jgi:hypothetical protein
MTFWEDCGEDDIKVNRQKRMDPLLRIYRGCCVLLTENRDVSNGIANGTQARVVEVVLKPNVVPFYVSINEEIQVQAVFASQVDRVELEHVNDRIHPRIFSVAPTEHIFRANMLKPHTLRAKIGQREELSMKATQIPFIINNATTGHKLQGCGIDILFIHGWVYVANWVYVMLSRVRTLNGLYMREPLSDDLSRYSVPQKLRAIIDTFRKKLSPTMWTDTEYNDKFS